MTDVESGAPVPPTADVPAPLDAADGIVLKPEAPDNSAQPAAAGWLGWNYALAVLLSAFLLFQVQPLISKFILPWFGGSPGVWTTAMLFFQVALFAGYAYAHLSQRLLSPRKQGIVHTIVLVSAVLLLPIAPSDGWKPTDSEHPISRILALLAISVGLPYFALSATGPLLQAWFSRACPGRSPYRLYALSNVGSLAALLSYPVVFEPAFDLEAQAWLWSGAFLIFAPLCGVCGYWVARKRSEPITPAASTKHKNETAAATASSASIELAPSVWRRAVWLLLPACASLLLLATTNHVCQDVAVMPFLWVAPLSLYLLTFIIAFDHERWYVRPVVCALAAASLLAVADRAGIDDFLNAVFDHDMNYVDELAIYFVAMFLVCLVCHGELVRSRPSPRYLTEFYLLISAGGALGGIFVSLVAPVIFKTFFEWKIAILVSYTLAIGVGAWGVGVWTASPKVLNMLGPARWSIQAALTCFGLLGIIPIYWLQIAPDYDDPPVAIARNFYGVVSVWDGETTLDVDPAEIPNAGNIQAGDAKQGQAPAPGNDMELAYRSLRNGHIVHGRQFVDPIMASLPISYYAPYTGIGQALTYFQKRPDPKMRVGVVGLGIGTIATYGVPGGYVRFYEINPQVLEMAEKYFTYLKNCQSRHDVALGDARLLLENEASQGFHVLALDAFSGDSIPTHLLTKEAFEIYDRHLAPDGVLAVHITNRYIDLAPVVEGLAEHFKFGVTRIYTEANERNLIYRADWMLLTRNAEFLSSHPSDPPDNVVPRRVRLWTDHYSNLFEILQ